jgi:glycosyltransferase involved in cell wall biosynthesis
MTIKANNTVILVCNSYKMLFHHRYNIINELLQQNKPLVLIAPPDKAISEFLKTYIDPQLVHNLSIQPIHFLPNSFALVLDLGLFLKLVNKLSIIRPQLVLSFTPKVNFFLGLANYVCRRKLVCVICGMGSQFISGGKARKLLLACYKIIRGSVKYFIVLNKRDQRFLSINHVISPAKLKPFPGEGINTSHYYPVKLIDKTKLLFVGRILQHKGFYELLDAVSRLRKKHPEYRLQVLGDKQANNLTAIATDILNQYEREGVFEYLGYVTDVRPILEQAGCVILPSYGEGLSRALMEAASMQRPIIASDIAGCRELVIHGKTGWLCKPRCADSLLKQLENFVDTDLDTLNKMGQLARNLIVEKYSDQVIIRHYQVLFDELKLS